MTENQAQEKNQDNVQVFRRLIDESAVDQARTWINSLHPAEIALLLESLPWDERDVAWEMVDPVHDGDILVHVNEVLRDSFIREMDPNELVAATESLDTDDLAEILPAFPDDVTQQILESMSERDRRRLEAVMSYAEDTAGRLMNTDTVTLRADVSLDVVLRYLRLRGYIPDMTDSLFVVDRDDRYVGLLLITDLLIKSPDALVSDVMTSAVEPINVNTPASKVAALFEQRDLISAPIVSEDGRLLGRVTIDDVVDIIREEADHSFLGSAGLSEETDIFAPVLRQAQRRAIWLGINLITVLFASWVVDHFQRAISEIVALAVLMPIVASMGGIAGSQTLTLIVRGLALGQVGPANSARVVSRELSVGLLNGVLWALVTGAVAALWFHNQSIGLVLGVAIIVNLFVGALSGALIPIVMRRMGMDPALGGSVLLTTVTDAMGFLTFLGLATLYLL